MTAPELRSVLVVGTGLIDDSGAVDVEFNQILTGIRTVKAFQLEGQPLQIGAHQLPVQLRGRGNAAGGFRSRIGRRGTGAHAPLAAIQDFA